MPIVEQVPATHWKSWAEINRAQILDVREPDEWEMGTLPNAVRISLGAVPYRIEALDKNKPVLVVCRSGARSGQAAEFLARAGFAQVANMAGGMHALGITV